jgi:Lrp/AsnC family transcriptional regulator, leucine-responsive regulatory protein
MRAATATPELNSLDFTILKSLLVDGRLTFKELAAQVGCDQRTIASRFDRMVELGIVKRVTLDVDWSKVGLTAIAYMGSTTTLGERDRQRLFDFIRQEPRILEAFTTIGTHEYFMKVLDRDIASLRSEICTKLEPLTVDLVTSVIVEPVKSPDYKGLLGYVERASQK